MSNPRVRKIADRIQVIVAEMLERRIKDPRLGFVDDHRRPPHRRQPAGRRSSTPSSVPRRSWQASAAASSRPRASSAPRSPSSSACGSCPRSPSSLTRSPRAPAPSTRCWPGPSRSTRRSPPSAAPPTPARPTPTRSPASSPTTTTTRTTATRSHRRQRRQGRRHRLMAESGLVVVDKSPGMTSHDVVARVRRLAGTRKVGHAGTLDPMATGVLVLGVERATRLLGHLMLTEKAYDATDTARRVHHDRRRGG